MKKLMIALMFLPVVTFAGNGDNPTVLNAVKKSIRFPEGLKNNQKTSVIATFHVTEKGEIQVEELRGADATNHQEIEQAIEQIRLKKGQFTPNERVTMKLTFVQQ